MVKKFSVGPSSYGDLRRVEQFVMSARIALQVLSVIVDFNAWQEARGAVGRLSVNEGMRSRARQSFLWLNRFVLGIVVAFPCTSLHDEVRRGNAVDFGITLPDGSNRALTAVEFAKLHELVEARGGTWTGKNFGEPWHHEMATRTERLAPYPDAAARAARTAKPTPPKKQQQTETLRRILMAAADTLTYYQRKDAKTGKPENTYFIAGPGLFVDLARADGSGTWLVGSTGLDSRTIRAVLNREGVKTEILAARDFDERRSLYRALADAAQGKAV